MSTQQYDRISVFSLECNTDYFCSLVERHKTTTTTTTTTTLQPFYGSLDCVQDYPAEPVPERQNQEGKISLDLLEQEIVSGSGISWAVCKSAP